MAIAQAKAKVEAAQARAAHANREIVLKVEQVCTQANLDSLKEEKERKRGHSRSKCPRRWTTRYGLQRVQ